MWSAVLALGLLAGLDPMRFGITLLVISRSRPVQNLLIYWLGCLSAFIPTVAVPLTLLHLIPTLKTYVHSWATDPTVRLIQFCVGLLVLSVAGLMTARLCKRRRAHLSAPTDNSSALADTHEPTPISLLLSRAQDAAVEGGSVIRRVFRRAYDAWESGSLWVALLIGIAFGGVAPELALIALTLVVASGAAIGAQVVAAILFVVGVLAVVEVALVSYLVAPAKTEALLRPLQSWALIHRQHLVIGILTVGGISLMASVIRSS
ncbi:GAP family protein [Mycobacterium xenopi]|uniref:Gap protein n=2 Tax=Mycobacterium xenopi TaxID=1789 RepID=A0AAD1LZ24_MYCXE|nr:GAP family protein [Mycobacterium xenopi]EUA24817.1 hypothetical protein I552_3728 [Mycobacterium xenopi 3993]MDA3641830.1 GAP family protein [Mycobacterium xenopi]MDA3659819.1 GAP family protein [Mycobacterium xenopi]SPX79666.1 Protein of uncharacterised function (DUF2910) [Mycobacterium xenopi]BBU20409.1 hypothetical protein MYXE_01980 [Mycobacterium xenopi]